MNQRITRRNLLKTSVAGATLGVGALLGYGQEAWQADAPFPAASGLATPHVGQAPPGRPLLLLVPEVHGPAFGSYLAEILRAEGLVGFRQLPAAALQPADLADCAAVILAGGPLGADQAALLRRFVAEGGGLIGLRPTASLGDLFGIRWLGEAPEGGRLYVRDGEGVDPGSLRFYGLSDILDLAGAEAVATGADGRPLVTWHQVGKGYTVAWGYDLAASIALQRQGNPAWADQDRDDILGVRASDMFVGWVDGERLHVPQADEQQRLFAQLVTRAATRLPLPRLWYFPAGAPSAIIATGDAHGSPAQVIAALLGRVAGFGGTMSIYYTPPTADILRRTLRKLRWAVGDLPLIGPVLRGDSSQPTPEDVASWRANGHEFGMHPYIEAGLEAGYNAYWNEFLKYGYGPLPPTVRTHRILWHGWVENARVQARYGLRMNLDHYHVGAAVRVGDTPTPSGFLNGSGLAMRFVGADGALLSVYQQHTHLVDEHLMPVFDTGHDMGLDGAQAAARSIAQIDACQRYPAALGLQCHIDPFAMGGEKAIQASRWIDTTLDHAAGAGLPILSAERWLAFLEGRSALEMTIQAWDREQGHLRLSITVPAGAASVELLVPLSHDGTRLQAITLEGMPTPWHERRLAGIGYAGIGFVAGSHSIEGWYARR